MSGCASQPLAVLPTVLQPQCSLCYTRGCRLLVALPVAGWLCRAWLENVLSKLQSLFLASRNNELLTDTTQPA